MATTKTIQSLERAFSILELFQNGKPEMSLKEIADTIQLNKSTTFGVSVIMSGMPAGSTTAILADKYEGDGHYASKVVFVSTLLSMITFPLLCIVL